MPATAQKQSIKDIISIYLREKFAEAPAPEVDVNVGEIERKARRLGRTRFGVRAKPSSYARKFREWRNDPGRLAALNVEHVREVDDGRRGKTLRFTLDV